MQIQKKEIIQENEQLNKRIAILESIQSEATDQKRKYMEGAVWMGKKLSNEIERVGFPQHAHVESKL